MIAAATPVDDDSPPDVAYPKRPRAVALAVLSEVRRRDAWVTAVLDRALAAAALESRDAAFVTRLVLGTVEAEGTLDEALGRFLTRPGSVEPRVRDALRAAAYELLFMQAPSHAAVNEWVAEIKRMRPRAAGMANAVLRRVAEAAPAFPWGDPGTDVAALARASAMPQWLVERFIADLGEDDARTALAAGVAPAPLYLWHDPFLGTFDDAMASLAEDGAAPEVCPWPGCIVAGDASAAVRSRAVADGLVLVTDAAAQVAALATGAHPGEIVVDATAGRGTKTAELQALSVAAGGPADLRALDLHAFKTRVLARRMADLGVPGVTVGVADASDPLGKQGVPAVGTAAAVLLDAPCTGLGTLRRHPEKRWRVTPGDITEMAAVQLRLLRGLSVLVAQGGRLVYATCSLAREENDGVADAFLATETGAEFERLDLAGILPRSWAGGVGTGGRFHMVPAVGGPDGHFVAAFQRRG
jgi:16S rRNA (cytosine967-C5)-methyltransferase